MDPIDAFRWLTLALYVLLFLMTCAGVLDRVGQRRLARAILEELHQLRRDTRRVRDELGMLYWLQVERDQEHRRREVIAARLRLEADSEGRRDAQTRIDVATVINDQRERWKVRE